LPRSPKPMRIKKSHRTATSSKMSRLSNNDEIAIQNAHLLRRSTTGSAALSVNPS
jgi:hypothetical protein